MMKIKMATTKPTYIMISLIQGVLKPCLPTLFPITLSLEYAYLNIAGVNYNYRYIISSIIQVCFHISHDCI